MTCAIRWATSRPRASWSSTTTVRIRSRVMAPGELTVTSETEQLRGAADYLPASHGPDCHRLLTRGVPSAERRLPPASAGIVACGAEGYHGAPTQLCETRRPRPGSSHPVLCGGSRSAATQIAAYCVILRPGEDPPGAVPA